MSFFGEQYPLYYPRYISGYEKVKITITNQTNTMATEPLTKGIVIFGATGDLCKKKLILHYINCGRKIFFHTIF